MLTCQELTELVTDWLEGRLPFRARVSFQFHLGMCWRCRAYLRQMRVTIRSLGRLPDELMPRDVKEELRARFRDMYPRAVVRAPIRPGRLGWGIATLAVLVAALVAIGTGGDEGPILGHWGPCLGTELAAAFLLLALGSLAALVRRRAFAAGTGAALSSLGALAGYAVLSAMCPVVGVTAHVLLVHAGAILVAALLGSLAPRLPLFRWR